MVRGFIRVAVVVVLLTWAGAAFLQWKFLERDIWLVEQHMSPFLSERVSGYGGWPVYAAEPEFLELSEDQRVEEAARFYDRVVRPLEPFYFTSTLEQWILDTARLSEAEAPVDYLDRRVPFRRFQLPGIVVAPNLVYIAFGSNVIGLTLIISVGIMGALIVAAIAIRWISRGFSVRTR